MAHERQAIRAAAVTALSGNTAAGSRVLQSRKAPNPQAELPQLNVYTLTDETDDASATSAPRELKRTVMLVVDAWIDASTDAEVEDALDAIALQVETAWDVADADDASALAKATFWSWPASTEMGVFVDGSKPIGCAHMTFHVDYHSDLRVADTDAARVPLKTIDAKFNLNDAQADADQAEDLITNLDA